ncbi:MAG: hypothetical protein KIB00_17465 [Paeniclostridium sordellii]|uniref:hypothetical protein n=1 Tax=Paraclostridium sordellii TaxID=1505 RepID=UPI0005432ED6|nr:hypothetical protein [Paeniclostridium sordellii]MBS6025864.1 hypothetical protein [Paeniclostridium sordellii]CEK35740.1 hypothetical protein UMC2_26331 [[Clostridium] sordellii] [Paeniclostridium sordellii]
MFKFINNLIPISRKRYKREVGLLKADILVLENKIDNLQKDKEFIKGLMKEDKETIDLLEDILGGKNREINRLELKNETTSKFLQEERQRNADLFKQLMDFIDKQEGSQVKAVG